MNWKKKLFVMKNYSKKNNMFINKIRKDKYHEKAC